MELGHDENFHVNQFENDSIPSKAIYVAPRIHWINMASELVLMSSRVKIYASLDYIDLVFFPISIAQVLWVNQINFQHWISIKKRFTIENASRDSKRLE